MSQRASIVRPVRIASFAAVGIAAAAMLALAGCQDSKSDTGSGSKPAGNSSPASGSGSNPSGR
jgi:hypothetical protein